MRGTGYSRLAVLASAAAALAGCGGGGHTESSGGSGEAMTRAEFVKAATPLCKSSRRVSGNRLEDAKAWAATGRGGSRRLHEKEIRFMVVEPAEALSRELEGLGPVSGDPNLDAYASTLAADARKASSKPLTVTAGTAFTASDELAEQAGLIACVH